MGATYDIDHLYGEDLAVTPTGDIALVSGQNLTMEHVIRRLLTSSTTLGQSDYPWEPNYGVGLAASIGDAAPDARALQAKVVSQLFLEDTVSRTPAPVVSVTQVSVNEYTINVSYTDLSGTPQNFSFNLTP